MNNAAQNLDAGVQHLIGRVIKSVEVGKSEGRVKFYLKDGTALAIWHEHDCSDCVYLEDIIGIDTVTQLTGETVLDAYVSYRVGEHDKDSTWGRFSVWVFLMLRTNNYSVVFRWYGTSNGYYSECPDSYSWTE